MHPMTKKQFSFFWITSCFVYVVLLSSLTDAFVRPSPTSTPRPQSRTARLFYHNNNRPEDVEIPVIGPILNCDHLIVGGTLWLSPPTPLQWKTIELCVKEQHGKNDTIAKVDAAPLVAVLHQGGSVTLAAIEGVVTSDKFQVDTSSSIAFQESMTAYYSETSKIRLLGIGRATLSGFSIREDKETCLMIKEDDDNEEGNQSLFSSSTKNDNDGGSVGVLCEEDEEDECEIRDDEDPIIREPVVMAKMNSIMDAPSVSDKGYGSRSSPVHGLCQLSIWASRINILHQGRQQKVQGLQAAQYRIDRASKEWQDWDGIGELYENCDVDQDDCIDAQKEIDDILENYPREFSRQLTPEAASLIQMKNYGLGTTSSAFSNLQSMTNVLVEKLQPYYSPDHVQTEEFEYSIFSFVVLQSLQSFLSKEEIQWAMQITSTSERLEILYDGMVRHNEALKEFTKAKSQELRDCGEECTDLF